MDRAAKLLIVLWACVALAGHTMLGRTWPGMAPTVAAIFGASAGLVAFDRRFVAPVLALTYVVPVLVRLLLGAWDTQYYPLWTAALLGAIVPDGLRRGWHLPVRWRGPLIAGALSVATSTTIVVARELDFNLALLGVMPEAVLSGLPVFFAAWTTYVGLTLVVGLLWFDWLIGAREFDLTRWVVAPLGVSLGALAVASLFQLTYDITFLNETVYAGIGRAGGTVYDANVAGTLAAAGVGGALFGASRYKGWPSVAFGLFALVLWAAVWASGSRTAFAAAAIVTATGAWSFGRPGALLPSGRAWVFAAAVVSIVVVLGASRFAAVGPLGRVWATLPGWSVTSMRAFGAEMWNRNGYGAASTRLIERFPVTGIGVGSFHVFGPRLAGMDLPPDNAQNWYRHQLVELGLLGAAGWLVFAALFGWMVVKPPPGLPAPVWCVRGILLAFGAISWLGVPTQELPASVTFWTAAAWYASLCGVTAGSSALGVWRWVGIGVVVLAFGVSTVHAATTTLRVPVRARAVGWPFSYGFYGPEPDLEGGEHRWAQRRATALVDASGRVLSLAVRVNHHDVVERPVHAKVWVEGQLVLDTRLTSGAPARVTVPISTDARQVVVDTWVDRVIRPRELGVPDDRELGLLVGWRFADSR